jgi:hypothetical protein
VSNIGMMRREPGDTIITGKYSRCSSADKRIFDNLELVQSFLAGIGSQAGDIIVLGIPPGKDYGIGLRRFRQFGYAVAGEFGFIGKRKPRSTPLRPTETRFN